MSMTDIHIPTPAETALLLNDPTSSVMVEQEGLLPDMQSYLKAFVAAYPDFTLEKKINRHDVIFELQRAWPKLAGWDAQEKRLLEYFDQIVHTLPAAGTSSSCVVRIWAVTPRQTPQALRLPQPEQAAVIAPLDAEGTLHQYIISGSKDLPPLRKRVIHLGLMMLSQSVPPMFNEFVDIRGTGLHAGTTDIYGGRSQDKLLSGDDPVAAPWTTPQAPLHQTHPHEDHALGEEEEEAIGGAEQEHANHMAAHAAEAVIIAAEIAAHHKREHERHLLAEKRREEELELRKKAAEQAELDKQTNERKEEDERKNLSEEKRLSGLETAEIAVLAAEAIKAESEITSQEEGAVPEMPERPEGAPPPSEEAVNDAIEASVAGENTVAEALAENPAAADGAGGAENPNAPTGAEEAAGDAAEANAGEPNAEANAEANPVETPGAEPVDAAEGEGATPELPEDVAESAEPSAEAEANEQTAEPAGNAAEGESPEGPEVEPADEQTAESAPDAGEAPEQGEPLSTGASGSPEDGEPAHIEEPSAEPEKNPVEDIKEQTDRMKKQLGDVDERNQDQEEQRQAFDEIESHNEHVENVSGRSASEDGGHSERMPDRSADIGKDHFSRSENGEERGRRDFPESRHDISHETELPRDARDYRRMDEERLDAAANSQNGDVAHHLAHELLHHLGAEHKGPSDSFIPAPFSHHTPPAAASVFAAPRDISMAATGSGLAYVAAGLASAQKKTLGGNAAVATPVTAEDKARAREWRKQKQKAKVAQQQTQAVEKKAAEGQPVEPAPTDDLTPSPS